MTTTQRLAQRYELRHLLGRGGMAYVYRAYDHTLERPVAVKVLRAEYANDPKFRERFRQEATAAARLSHPNIVTVYDFGYDDEHLFMVMEYVPGMTLRALIDEQGPLPIEQALRLAIQACAGLGYAHRVGLVHCDVKPQNLLVTSDGRLKVADFGIARARMAHAAATEDTVVWGSPLYFSPEQAAGKPPVAASDVYALGIVLYEMLTKHTPFLADDPMELVRMHREAPPVPPTVYRPEIPERVEQVIMHALSKEPSRRYRTADQMGRVLLSCLEGLQQESETAAPPAPAAISPPAREETPAAPEAASPTEETWEDETGIDWITILLAFVALVAVGGLIPLWVWVFLAYQSTH